MLYITISNSDICVSVTYRFLLHFPSSSSLHCTVTGIRSAKAPCESYLFHFLSSKPFLILCLLQCPIVQRKKFSLSQKSVTFNPLIFPYLDLLSYIIQNPSSFASYFIRPFLWEYIHTWGSHLVFTGTQKQTQVISKFQCLLTILFSFNMLHLHCGILIPEYHYLFSDLFFRLPMLLWG